jgi:hypothetical protein
MYVRYSQKFLPGKPLMVWLELVRNQNDFLSFVVHSL